MRKTVPQITPILQASILVIGLVVNTEMVKLVKSPEFWKKMEEMGAEPIGSTPAQMATRIKGDTGRFAKLVKEATVTIE